MCRGSVYSLLGCRKAATLLLYSTTSIMFPHPGSNEYQFDELRSHCLDARIPLSGCNKLNLFNSSSYSDRLSGGADSRAQGSMWITAACGKTALLQERMKVSHEIGGARTSYPAPP